MKKVDETYNNVEIKTTDKYNNYRVESCWTSVGEEDEWKGHERRVVMKVIVSVGFVSRSLEKPIKISLSNGSKTRNCEISSSSPETLREDVDKHLEILYNNYNFHGLDRRCGKIKVSKISVKLASLRRTACSANCPSFVSWWAEILNLQ